MTYQYFVGFLIGGFNPSETWWSSSVGMSMSNMWKVVKFMFQTTKPGHIFLYQWYPSNSTAVWGLFIQGWHFYLFFWVLLYIVCKKSNCPMFFPEGCISLTKNRRDKRHPKPNGDTFSPGCQVFGRQWMGCWGLLGWWLLLIMEHSRKFPALSTSKKKNMESWNCTAISQFSCDLIKLN